MLSRRRLLAKLSVIMVAPIMPLALSGCGRKGDLEPPPDRGQAPRRSYPPKALPKDEQMGSDGTEGGSGDMGGT